MNSPTTVRNDRRFLGVFVNPIEVQSEGLEAVFANLESIGTTAVCTGTQVARRVESGVRFPDLHVDGHRRVLGREIWGARELSIESFSTLRHDLKRYSAEGYRPRVRERPPELSPDVPGQIIAAARARGWKAHLLLSPMLVPDLRDEDRPVRIDGSIPRPPLVADVGTPSSPLTRSYCQGLVLDALDTYPDLDGLFLDWVEFGAYALEDHFSCVGPHTRAWAGRLGMDWNRILHDLRAGWNWLHDVDPQTFVRTGRELPTSSDLLELAGRTPGWRDFLWLKAEIVTSLYRDVRETIDQAGFAHVEVSARGWPPPWNRTSGMDYKALAVSCHASTPKLFTFDYSALPRWYGAVIKRWNPSLSEGAILDRLVRWMDLPDDIADRRFDHYRIPEPDELHPAKLESYAARVQEVADEVAGRARLHPIAHAYLPEPQWRTMLELLREGPANGIWIQMYGYLSDPKLAIVRETWRA